MSQYLHDYSAFIYAALAALALIFAFLGWMKARATNLQLEFVLQELNRRTTLPTPDEVAKAVMRRMAAQQNTSDTSRSHEDRIPRDPYNQLAELAPAVGTAKSTDQPVRETRIQYTVPNARRTPAYAQHASNTDDDRELPRFDPYRGIGGDYGPRQGAFAPQRTTYLEPAMS